jgi:hypothetical protein
MTSTQDDSASPAQKTSIVIHETMNASDATAVSLACAILGVCAVYVVVLDWRFAYIHQIPVWDIDYITALMMYFARNWWTEGPWHMLFSMPYAPLSVETPTPDLRYGMYQSWPPGAVLPIYLLALLTNTEPNITMVNWLNVAGHGLIALFLSLSAYVAVLVLRRPRIEGVALAIAVACVVLLPRGPVYLFSQVYAFDDHVVVFYALFVFVTTLELHAADRDSARRYYYLEITVLVYGLFVDWLSYFVYAVWFVLRLAGARTGYGRRLGRSEAIGLAALPLVSFSMFLVWRFVTPGSVAAEQGVLASVKELLWKVIFRIGDTDDHPMSATSFFGPFYEAHRDYYWDMAPILIGGGFIFCLALFAVLFRISRSDMAARRTYFGLFSIFLLSIVPAYTQMLVFKQHTLYHPSSIAKIVVPLAMVPGVFLPLLTVTALGRWQALSNFPWQRPWRIASTIAVLGFAVWIGVSAWPTAPYLLGRIDPTAAVPWLTIHERTAYADVVFSPDFDTAPFGIEASVAGKLVYRARSFAEVDQKVSPICVPFNVVIVRKSPDGEERFDNRTPDQVIRAGGLTLLRFQNYRGAAKSCPKA